MQVNSYCCYDENDDLQIILFIDEVLLCMQWFNAIMYIHMYVQMYYK